jgi:iron complex transport system substrate-binding protein
LNVESVLALAPDLVIAKEDLRPALEHRGVSVLWIPPASDLEAIIDVVEQIGARLHVPEKSQALVARLRSQAAAIGASVAGLPKVRVYYEAGRPGRTAGRNTVIDEMIRLAGGVNIAGESELANPVLSSEAIVAADPEVIVLSPWCEPVASVAARPGWSRITAVRAGRVHAIPERERQVQYPSPSCVEGCARLLVPWLHTEIGGAK